MTIVLAGAGAAGLADTVGFGANLQLVENPLTTAQLPQDAKMLVSFGYRHLVPPSVLDALGGQALNLHISLLPWNKGSDPNLWSWLENTPKGVTIHWMSKVLDQGDIIAQRSVHFGSNETLRTSYNILVSEVTSLFRETWPLIIGGQHTSSVQSGPGTYHRSSDKREHLKALHSGWDTPCGDVAAYGRRCGLTIKHES